MYSIKKVFNPEMFQGNNKRKAYFEGWYFKMVSPLKDYVGGIIPGISYDSYGNGHAFIQAIDVISGKTYYFKYPLSEFNYSKDRFEVTIGKNFFSSKLIELNLVNEEVNIIGSLSFHNIVPYPKSPFSPGVMGPFSFVPFMECYHGVINIHHEIKGSLSIDDSLASFTGGYGYIEKDWGKSFPESWIWLQCNHFTNSDISLMFSIAKIPFLMGSFVGFLSFIKIKEKIYNFATYTGARITSLNYSEGQLKISIEDKSFSFIIEGSLGNGGVLKAPSKGFMNREITESISSKINFKLYSKSKALILEDHGLNCGMEICGDYNLFAK